MPETLNWALCWCLLVAAAVVVSAEHPARPPITFNRNFPSLAASSTVNSVSSPNSLSASKDSFNKEPKKDKIVFKGKCSYY